MARINFEEKWWHDPRRKKLIRAYSGDEEKADGVAANLWRLAQGYVYRGRSVLPREVFEHSEARPHLINAGLVVEETDGFYVCGSAEFLGWVEKKIEAGRTGGRTSAQRPRDEKGRLLPKVETPEDPSTIQAESKCLQPSISISSSISKRRKLHSSTDKPSSEFDFEIPYRDYPRKEGKQRGMKTLAREVRTPEDFERLCVAVRNYADRMRQLGTEGKFMKHFATFVGEWRDWIQPEALPGKPIDATDWSVVFGTKDADAPSQEDSA